MEIAHAFNNLLTVIGGSSALLAGRIDERRDQPEVWEHLAEIQDAVEKAAVLTRQMLAFSRQPVVPFADGAAVSVLEAPAAPGPSDTESDDALARVAGVVLLVEDDRQVRRVLRLILERAGFTVLEASEGLEALMVLETHNGSIHLLVCDLVLPRLGGREVLAHAQALRPDLKALFVSGCVDSVAVSWEMTHGVAFLQKPFVCQDLVRVARELVG